MCFCPRTNTKKNGGHGIYQHPKKPRSAIKRSRLIDSPIVLRTVRQSSCEDDLILIPNQISGASTPRRARPNRLTAFKCTFCAGKPPSPECSVTRYTAARKALDVLPGSSNVRRSDGRPNAARNREHSRGGVGVKGFSCARSSSIPRIRLRNLVAASRSIDQRLQEGKTVRFQFRRGSAAARRCRPLGRAR